MRYGSWVKAAFWLALVFAFVMATLPHPPNLPAGDKVQHMLAFFTLTVLGLAAWPQRPVLLSCALALFGALIEGVQLIPMLHRTSDFHDWLADMLAVGVAVSGYAALAKRARR